MSKKAIVAMAIAIVAAVGIGTWYYFSQLRPTKIENILHNPKAFEGKEVTIEGEVTDRTSFFGVIKFFKVRDKTGEIIVVARKSLPETKSNIHLKGRIDDAFQIGDQKIVVFSEESFEAKGKTNEKNR